MINSKTDILVALILLNVLAVAYFLIGSVGVALYLQSADFSLSLLWWVSIMASVGTYLAIDLDDRKTLVGSAKQ
jgi:hypothetical protein